MLGKLRPLSVVPKSCQALLGSFSKGELYILNRGQQHIMLEASLEESFLCSEIILSGCLKSPLRMKGRFVVSASQKQAGLQTRLSGFSFFWELRAASLGEGVFPLGEPQISPNNDEIHLSNKDSFSIYQEPSPT